MRRWGWTMWWLCPWMPMMPIASAGRGLCGPSTAEVEVRNGWSGEAGRSVGQMKVRRKRLTGTSHKHRRRPVFKDGKSR
ncbi:hypothetical protein F5X68DRAFT_31000 [Plectosphaerella plurivora]|uniref:Secreted protein n=1 Tax=Plectosphaerella plurivora TaxID=936078 RepID=A0A9P8VKF8_9PEZI|nr:hypothetical protein F5X68DRAFT_31000 [Plectosphaerella plurivora]